jgi:hypothetical protein
MHSKSLHSETDTNTIFLFGEGHKQLRQGLLVHACFFLVCRLAPILLDLLSILKILGLVWNAQPQLANKMEYSPIVFLPPEILHTELKPIKTIE